MLIRRRSLTLCFDAFGTLIRPRRPVAEQYAGVAQGLGLTAASETKVADSLRAAFTAASISHPNYGRLQGTTPDEWWGNVIRDTFSPFLKPGQELPEALIPTLLKRFKFAKGYELVEPEIITKLRELRSCMKEHHVDVVVGVITNSDDRIASVLQSFGMPVSHMRYGHAAALLPVPDLSLPEPLPRCSYDEAVATVFGHSTPNTFNRFPTPQPWDIDFVCTSYDVGVEKPGRGIFRAAELTAATLHARGRVLAQAPPGPDGSGSAGYPGLMQDFSKKRDTMLKYGKMLTKILVGDDLEADGEGARGAGWYSSIIRPGDPGREGQDKGPTWDHSALSSSPVESDLGAVRKSTLSKLQEADLSGANGVCGLLDRLMQVARETQLNSRK